MEAGPRATHLEPFIFLHEALLPYNDTLEHFSLKTTPSYNAFFLASWDLISDFTKLPRLRYLEFDAHVLRTQKGEQDEVPPSGIPSSLAKILPASIEDVRMLAYNSKFQILHAMLRSLPHRRARYPNLRTFEIAMNGVSSIHTLSRSFESEERLITLQAALEDFGIQLAFQRIVFERNMLHIRRWEY
ncbi:hypothetical protein BT63DRAFT_418637 [Microthyrium microscopicum]|uniref:Uncharacterized protein n=1 Tax=Microthyrium microscopicum TaxID=703497 RepID=A0A6A6TY02_9PEZI|nr:hypothetical protein BT63DRAFT_418637 [Microthyrium microscopicum]